MEQLDDMIRNSLAGEPPAERFEFKEEYWLQAQALIENFERRKKRRRWWLWWSAGVLGASALTYLAFLQTKQNHTPTPAETPIAAISGEGNNISQKKHADRATIDLPSASIEQKSAENKYDHTERPAALVLSYTKNALSQSEKLDPIHPSASLSQVSTPVLDAHNTGQAENTTAPVQDETTFYNTSSVSDPTETPLLTPALTAPPLLPGREPTSVSRSAPFMPVALPHLPAIPSSGPTTIRRQPQRLNMGLVANAGTYSGYFYQENPSFALGITQRYVVKNRWSIQADLLWRRSSGNGLRAVASGGNPSYMNDFDRSFSSFSKISNQRTYSFGFTDQTAVETIRAIHWVEMPLSLHYRFRQFGIEAGGFVSRMLTLGKYTENYASSSLQRIPTLQESERSTQKPEGVRRWETGYMAGIHWEPNRRWSIGARVYRRTSPEINFNFASQVSQAPVRNIATAELRLRYFL